jgi:hypothetical protein
MVIKMPQINSTLSINLINEIQEIAKKTNKSFSRFVSELIEQGLKLYKNNDVLLSQKTHPNNSDLESKHTEYLLRILAISADILRCTRNNKSKYSEKETDDVINTITSNVQKYIKNYNKF